MNITASEKKKLIQSLESIDKNIQMLRELIDKRKTHEQAIKQFNINNRHNSIFSQPR